MATHKTMDASTQTEAIVPLWPLEKRITGAHGVAELPGKKTFQSLSHDVKSCIIEQVNRPSDLKNVCLVSRELHEIAVRFLYHDVSIELGSLRDYHMPAFMSRHNIGLKHIRKITLFLSSVPDPCNSEQQATFAISMLLGFLPENILEEFRCGFTET
jgi:hypothetical protein